MQKLAMSPVLCIQETMRKLSPVPRFLLQKRTFKEQTWIPLCCDRIKTSNSCKDLDCRSPRSETKNTESPTYPLKWYGNDEHTQKTNKTNTIPWKITLQWISTERPNGGCPWSPSKRLSHGPYSSPGDSNNFNIPRHPLITHHHPESSNSLWLRPVTSDRGNGFQA